MNRNKKIKICALTTISKTMDWFIVDSMRNLSNNGYDVTLICDMEDGFKERNSDYANCINIPMSRGISVGDLIKIPLRLCKIFKKEKFDVIYFSSPNVSLYAAFAGILAGVKFRIYSQCGIRYVSFSGIKGKIFKFVEKLTCFCSTHVKSQSPKNMQFAVSEKLCKDKKISVVGIGGTIGVDLVKCDGFDHTQARAELRDKYQIPQNAFVYGYVGRINKDKGINELVKAFVQLQKKHENIYLVLIGMIDEANPIEEKNWQIVQENPYIILTGNVDHDLVYPHMTIFDALVHPTYREGFGMVLQEAMAMSLPIITTDIPGPSEVIENGISGFLVNPCDSVDLEEKMTTIYGNVDLCKQLGNAGRIRVEKFFARPVMLDNILCDMNKILEKRNDSRYSCIF